MVKFYLKYIFTILCTCLVISGFSLDYTSIKSGNWNDPTAWFPIGIPGNGDNATIDLNDVITIQAGETITCDNIVIKFSSDAEYGTLNVLATATLTTTGNINQQGYFNVYGTVNVADIFKHFEKRSYTDEVITTVYNGGVIQAANKITLESGTQIFIKNGGAVNTLGYNSQGKIHYELGSTGSISTAGIVIRDHARAGNPISSFINEGNVNTTFLTLQGGVVSDNAGATSILVENLGTLTCSKYLKFDNTNSYYYDNADNELVKLQFINGSETTAGTCNVNDSIVFRTGLISNPSALIQPIDTTVIVNSFKLLNGTVNLTGQLKLGTEPSGLDYPLTAGINQVIVDDSYPTIKEFHYTHTNPFVQYQGGYYLGNLSTGQQDCLTFFEPNTNSFDIPIPFPNQYGQIHFGGLIDTVSVNDTLALNQIYDTVFVASSLTFKIDSDTKNFDNIYLPGVLDMAEDTKFFVKNSGLPKGVPEGDGFNFTESTLFEFRNTSATPYEVFSHTAIDEIHYPKVILTGSGEKVFSSNALAYKNNTDYTIDYVELQDGSLTFEKGVGFNLANEYGFNNTYKRVFKVKANTTVNIEGNFGNVYVKGDFDRYCTFHYNEDGGNQKVYAFISQDNSLDTEPYGILKYSTASGTNVKRLITDEIHVENRLDIGENIRVQHQANGYTRLLSDATYTAYVSEVPASASFRSNGGNFIVEKHLYYNGYTAADLCSSVQDKDLNMLMNNGIFMGGFPGSNAPSQRFSSVSYYNETEPGQVNFGFSKPTNANQKFFEFNGSNQVTHAGFRMNIPTSTRTIQDTGFINTGDFDFLLTFNYTNAGNSNDRIENDGYNMLANPYPAGLDLDLVYNDPDNKAVFDAHSTATVYTYQYFNRRDIMEDNSTGYSFYNMNTGAHESKDGFTVQDNIIPSSTAFWVKAYEVAALTAENVIQIKESHKADLETSRNLKNGKRVNPLDLAGTITLYQDTVQKESIYFHYWKKASLAHNPTFDVQRYHNNRNLALNFAADNGDNLNLKVNAFAKPESNFEIPLLLNNPKGEDFTIELNNLGLYLANFPCVKLIDLKTGVNYPLKENNRFTFTGVITTDERRFILQFSKNIEEALALTQPKCADDLGAVSLDVSSINTGNTKYTLENTAVAYAETFLGNINSIEKNNLPSGTYTLTNHTGLLTCTTNSIEFTIYGIPKLLNSISVSHSIIIQNQAIQLSVQGNAAAYLWRVENAQYIGAKIVHPFAFSGIHTIEVQALNHDSTCIETLTKNIEVQELKTGVHQNNKDQVFIYTNTNTLKLNKPALVQQVLLYDSQGKTIYSGKNLRTLQLQTGAYIAQIQLLNQQLLQQKIVIP